MKKSFHLHIGLMIAKALYDSREQHLADIETLRAGVNAEGVELTLQDKLLIVDRMLNRAGKTVVGLWVPSVVLVGLESLWEKQKADFMASHKARTEPEKKWPTDSVA